MQKNEPTELTLISRYWDCCKPSCAWDDKASVSAPVLTCDASDNPISDASTTSGCDGGTAYSCSDNSPWAVNDNLAYGFAATNIEGGSESSWCCACYALTFTSGAVKGKTMVVQSTNTGSDLGSNQFDLLMPGGGVGIFDGCTSEFGTALPGEQYGGISSASQCSSFPAILQDGCDWRFDWFENSDNPEVTFEQVQCPTAITDISGCIRDDDGDYPIFNAGSSSGSSSTSAAAASSSSKASTQASTKASTTAAAQETEAANTQATAVQSSAVQNSVVQSSVVQSSAIQSSAAQTQPVEETESAVQTEAPATEQASTQSPSSIQTRTRTRTKASGCAARKSTTLKASSTPEATGNAVSAASASTSTVALFHQCNGSKASFPDGALPCASGSTCVYSNDWYSQCQPN
ncbi:RlpA-like double-psi beta-barrel-protein domain-containing protein-containing protein [Thelonectria olida]|uniref:cellulase n=1 Tax=Thelonectria olida TaxID=1576542 RepID=A0A9P9AUM2_9HYPO|nr:RlpA-like double-psi beta-barrel-protein domain-containing protein-containing protein [Thelonectria olida]